MSLQFIIDGYNIINHPEFLRHANKSIKDPRVSLVNLINTLRLTGSSNNALTIFFDGFSSVCKDALLADKKARIIFSGEKSADELIMRMIEKARVPADCVVVSDDKEIIFFARACGAKALAVEDFIMPKRNKRGRDASPQAEPSLNHGQMRKINDELKKIWLK